jgi:hypothetical protein
MDAEIGLCCIWRMTRQQIIERALALARSGQYGTAEDVTSALVAKGISDAAVHLRSNLTQRLLRGALMNGAAQFERNKAEQAFKAQIAHASREGAETSC